MLQISDYHHLNRKQSNLLRVEQTPQSSRLKGEFDIIFPYTVDSRYLDFGYLE